MSQDALDLSNLVAARNLAAAGIPIFPAAVYQQEGSNVWQKKPLIRGWQKLATTDLEQIELWWQQHPSAVPAIEVGRAGLVVLDGDRHGGPDGVQALDDVLGTATPAHPVSLTAGGGVHHIFSQPPDVPPLTNQRGSLPPGVDVRGQGGWIVAPGSVRPDGNCYEQKPGTPSLAEAFGNGSIPVIPQRALELITQPAAPARLSKEPPTLADVPAPSVNKPPGNRELAYGRQLLEGSCADVINASRGQRNDTLNAASYRVGRAVASGWVDENAATRMLTQAAATNGLVGDDGLRSVEATIRSGLQAGMQKPLEPLQDRELRLPGAIVTGLDNVGRPKSALHWHGNDNDATTPRWLVKKMLLQSGVAIMSGQWSSGKTFVALELAYCVAMGEPFAGRLVKRPGGTLFFAAEAEGDIPIRLRGLVTERSQDPSTLLPFAWVGEMPRLRDPEAANHLAELAHEAADGMKDKFGVELALIVIDTMAAAAGFDNENDASEAQQVMTVLHALARQTGALVLAVDHFGKDADRGTRGSIAKESSADNVLALLADQRLTGAVSGRTLVLRKLRGGVTGYQVAFELAPVKLGVDEDGDEITTCVVRFLDGPVPRNASGAVWNRLQDLRQAVDVGLGISRQKLRPFGADGPLVEATPLDTVRMEFYRAYPAEGDDQHQRKDARRKAFWRKLGKAKERGLVATRDIDGVDWIWFASSDSAHANQRGNPPSFTADVGFG